MMIFSWPDLGSGSAFVLIVAENLVLTIVKLVVGKGYFFPIAGEPRALDRLIAN